jgi:hypothetical protein
VLVLWVVLVGVGDGEDDVDYVVVFVFPRRPYARMLQPSVS